MVDVLAIHPQIPEVDLLFLAGRRKQQIFIEEGELMDPVGVGHAALFQHLDRLAHSLVT